MITSGNPVRYAQLYSENFTEGGVGPHGQKIIVPAGECWIPIAARGTFLSSAQVANRAIHAGITFEAGGKTIETVWAPKSTKASEHWLVRLIWGLGSNPFNTEWAGEIEGVTGVVQIPMAPIVLRPGNKLYLEALGEQSEDKWNELSLCYERIPTIG